MQTLQSMFSNMDPDIIRSVLRDVGNNMEQAVDSLLNLEALHVTTHRQHEPTHVVIPAPHSHVNSKQEGHAKEKEEKKGLVQAAKHFVGMKGASKGKEGKEKKDDGEFKFSEFSKLVVMW